MQLQMTCFPYSPLHARVLFIVHELSLFSVDMSALCIIAHIACITQYCLKQQWCSCTSMHNVVLLFYSCNTLGFDVACETFGPIISMTFC